MISPAAPDPTFTAALRAVVRRAVRDIAALVLPQACAGCAESGARLCERCLRELVPTVQPQDVGGMTVWSGLRFEGTVARIIRSCKEDARPVLARELAPALRAALAAVAETSLPGEGSGPLLVVPVPASGRALRIRGFRLVEVVARAAGVAPVRALRQLTATRDQRELGIADRAQNVAGALRASGVRGARVVLVDDVVTSGATLTESARALSVAGAIVVGAATVAATPRRYV